jgi:hypothetical protein
MSESLTAPRLTLRQLPLAARLTLALFLISTGIGYISALVQLHFQHASPGSPLPTPDDAVRIFHGPLGKPVSQLERLLTADEHEKFNGTGSMAAAFTRKSADWKKAVKKRPEAEVQEERDGERKAVLEWIAAGACKADYENDAFALPDKLRDQKITSDYVTDGDSGARQVKIKKILDDRCVRCHCSKDPEDASAGKYPLDTYETLRPRALVEAGAGAMSLTKLAQTTHVHLLGFSMLYGLSGLILAFSSYPALLRVILCPLPLLAQVADISFWWLARLPEPIGPEIARLIAVSGGVVAVSLLLHLVLSLFDLFSAKGKLVLVLLFGGVIAGAATVHRNAYISDFLSQEAKGVETESK